MRLSTGCAIIVLLACATAAAQESFPATHIARLDILEPDPNAGTIGGVAIIAINPATGIAQIRVTAAPEGDAPDTLLLLYQPASGSDIVVARMPFPATSPTLTTTIPLIIPAVASSIDSGHVWLAVTRRSDHTRYVEGPVTSVLSAVAPEPSGAEVVPPVTGTDGAAHLGLTYDPTANAIRYTAWWLDLSGPATAARIRRGAIGSTGPVVLELPLTSGSDQSIGVWENPGADLRSAIVNGELYFEITSAQFPNGELRGQIYPVEGFTAAIEPGNENPPVTGTTASGSAYLMITAHGTIEVFNKLQGVIGNLSGPMTAAHIHRGAIGQSGPPAVTLERPTATTIDLELASGSAGGAMSDEVVNEIRATRTYVNVHTAANQSGEARGQLIPAVTRLAAPTGSVRPDDESGARFTARYDRSSNAIVVTSDRRAASILLFSADGRLARAVACEGERCAISAEGLPAGPYFMRLRREDGSASGSCGVMVMP